MGVKVSSLTHRLEIDSLEIKNSLKTAAAALVCNYVFVMTSFYLQNFDAMLGEILDVMPDANDWMLEHQGNNDHTVLSICNYIYHGSQILFINSHSQWTHKVTMHIVIQHTQFMTDVYEMYMTCRNEII